MKHPNVLKLVAPDGTPHNLWAVRRRGFEPDPILFDNAVMAIEQAILDDIWIRLQKDS